MILINSGNVVYDNSWLWRADHDIGGAVKNSMNPVKNGIVVNGDNVKAYGLAVEHTLNDLVVWNGDNGMTLFYQSELPYDVNQTNFGDKGYVSYRINDNVDTHFAFGVGAYSFFAYNNVTVNSGFYAPKKPGIKIQNALTVFLNGMGSLKHVVDDQGVALSGHTSQAHVCEFNNTATAAILE